LPPALQQVQRLLGTALQTTAALWPPVERAYGWVHRAAHLLKNTEGLTGEEVQARYERLLVEMEADQPLLGPLAGAVDAFRKVTASFAPGLFHCYTVPDLPQTNNDLERCFGAVRYHERRATGRRGAVPGLVVRGAVRVLTALVCRRQPLSVEELPPADYTAWRHLRQQLTYREEARRQQGRFRKAPAVYLAAIEQQLLM
jgi:hypothetical protein